MEYMYIVANRTNSGGWLVSVRDGVGVRLGEIEGELQRQLTKLHGEGWALVSTAATENTLTVIFRRGV